jgi:hypothetical protein
MPNGAGAAWTAYTTAVRWADKFGRATWVALLFVLLSLEAAPAAQAAPAVQSVPGAAPQFYLLPAQQTNVVLETHLADLSLTPGDGGASLVMDASYRLRNPTEETVSLGLQLAPGGDQSISGFSGLTLTSDGAALPLTPAGDGGYTSQVSIPADGRANLRLVYQVALGNNALALVRYAPAVLNQWPGNISLRVQMMLSDAFPSDGWMEIAPSGWSYGVLSDPTSTNIKWLYDASIPDEAFVFRFIEPNTWTALQGAEQAAGENGPPANFVLLANLYRRLYSEATNDSLRSRFYAQAVAAYTAGLRSGATGAAPQDQAALHVGLANLYRDQAVQTASAEVAEYARLVVQEVDAALALLPATDPQRAELGRWQVDGLTVLLNEAYDQEDWPQALAIVERLAQLPAELVDPAYVAEERRAVLVQQGLQFMEQGNREAAMAVAGDQIAADGLTPPDESYPLFASWQMTVTAGPDTLRLESFAFTDPDRHELALSALEEVVQVWEEGVQQASTGGGEYRFTLEDVHPPLESGEPTGVRLTVDFPLSANGLLLAQLMPPRVDWALLNTVLTQLAPTSQRKTELLWQQVSLSQPLDLRNGVAQWEGIAAGLEQQAAEVETAGGSVATKDVVDAEAALRARIQAVNYRAAATEWRALARQSWLLFTFAVDDPLFTTLRQEVPSRSWYATLASPSQMFVFQAQVLHLNRLLTLMVMGLTGLIGAASVLWWLL